MEISSLKKRPFAAKSPHLLEGMNLLDLKIAQEWSLIGAGITGTRKGRGPDQANWLGWVTVLQGRLRICVGLFITLCWA